MENINSFQQFFRVQSPPPALFNQSRIKTLTPSKQKSTSQQREQTTGKRKSNSFNKKQDTASTRIFVRFRPLNENEWLSNTSSPVQFQDEKTVVVAGQPFTLDRVFSGVDNQSLLYERVAQPTVKDVMNGVNGTIIAYGQTGSGKTYTMLGPQRDKGIIYRAISEILSKREVSISLLEVYKESINDLLNGLNDLKLKEDPQTGVYVERLSRVQIENETQLMELIQFAEEKRHVAETRFNSYSSRSHLILTVHVNQGGKLNLVDLAGSEKVAKTGAKGETLEEAKKINSSLSCLGHVVQSLSQGLEHIPFRDSKLTRILQDSLQGFCRTSLIVNCSPHHSSVDETISSLKFATRAKLIKPQNRIVTEKRSYKDLEDEVSILKDELVQTKHQLKQAMGNYATLQTQVDHLEEATLSAKRSSSPVSLKPRIGIFTTETPPNYEYDSSYHSQPYFAVDKSSYDTNPLDQHMLDLQKKISFFLQGFSNFIREFQCTQQAKCLSGQLMELNSSIQALFRLVKAEDSKHMSHIKSFEDCKKYSVHLKTQDLDGRGTSFSHESANIRVDQILNQVALTEFKPSDNHKSPVVQQIILKTDEDCRLTPTNKEKENIEPDLARRRSVSRKERQPVHSASQRYLKTSDQRIQTFMNKIKRV